MNQKLTSITEVYDYLTSNSGKTIEIDTLKEGDMYNLRIEFNKDKIFHEMFIPSEDIRDRITEDYPGCKDVYAQKIGSSLWSEQWHP
jgi:hypothetical protein